MRLILLSFQLLISFPGLDLRVLSPSPGTGLHAGYGAYLERKKKKKILPTAVTKNFSLILLTGILKLW